MFEQVKKSGTGICKTGSLLKGLIGFWTKSPAGQIK
jgi:hypothetical protein